MHLVIQEETSKGINISQLDNEKHFDLQYINLSFQLRLGSQTYMHMAKFVLVSIFWDNFSLLQVLFVYV